MKRLLAIDFGENKIGLAISDPGHIIATPLTVIRTKEQKDPAKVEAILEALGDYKKEISGIVLGLPLEKSGREGKMAIRTRLFAEALKEKFDVEIHFFDERLSSKQAMRFLQEEAGLNRKKASKLEDQTAACLLLQSFLDAVCV